MTGTGDVATARALRTQIRAWRRGRAELGWGEVISEAYAAAVTVLVLGSMATSVLLGLQDLFAASCEGRCQEVRSALPWVGMLGSTVIVLGLARLVGPVFSPPAAGAWLLSTPVDRGALLRPALLRALLLAGAAGSVVALPPVLMGSDGLGPVLTATLAAGLVAAIATGLAAVAQVRESPLARVLWWGLSLALWALLLLVALDALSFPSPGAEAAMLVPAGLAAAASGWAAVRVLPRAHRRVLALTQRLVGSLSGALAALDLGLLYDVLLDRRWNAAASVRSRPARGRYAVAFVSRDLWRLVRSPQPVLVLAPLLLVPYAAGVAGAGRVTPAVAALCAFLAAVPLMSGLRVLTRSRTLARSLPMPRRTLVLAHLVVPGVLLMLWGLAAAPSWAGAWRGVGAAGVGVAVALSGTAAAVRWVTGPPPDYLKPMVSTPAGAVPTGLFGSALRGFDVWLLTALPMLFGWWGPLVSAALSLAVLAVLVGRESTG